MEANNNDPKQAFFVPPDGSRPDFSPSITSFLCTDAAHDIFTDGGRMLDTMSLDFSAERFPNQIDGSNHSSILTNAQCFSKAREFFNTPMSRLSRFAAQALENLGAGQSIK
jgi:hypothetical protein